MLERPGGRLSVLVELLLRARVFAFLEQVFGVALASRVGERERAILAVPARAYALKQDTLTKLVFRSWAAREA